MIKKGLNMKKKYVPTTTIKDIFNLTITYKF